MLDLEYTKKKPCCKKCKDLNKSFYLDLIKYLIVKNRIAQNMFKQKSICLDQLLNKNLFVQIRF